MQGVSAKAGDIMVAITPHVHGDKFNNASGIFAACRVSTFNTKQSNKYEAN
jgi:hypothetical protein